MLVTNCVTCYFIGHDHHGQIFQTIQTNFPRYPAKNLPSFILIDGFPELLIKAPAQYYGKEGGGGASKQRH